MEIPSADAYICQLAAVDSHSAAHKSGLEEDNDDDIFGVGMLTMTFLEWGCG